MKEYHGGIPHSESNYMELLLVHCSALMDVAGGHYGIQKLEMIKKICLLFLARIEKFSQKFSTQGFLKFKSHKQE